MKTDISGVILAGGRNTRMGINKAFIELEGRPMIDRAVEFLQGLFPEVIIVTNDPSLYLHLPVAIVTDIYKDKGSLGGLYTGLFHAAHDYAFVVPCDMPFLNRGFIEYMINCVGQGQIVVPEPADGLQPLHAIYGRSTLPLMARFLAGGSLKIIDLYQEVKTMVIPREVIGSFDPAGRMF
ncbi:MAG: molybdenum cofactor guanylyltransferase, partial [Smithellaceae bacterium]|nr:molybdenum cofactor guanylyltransferase [Smithellaceae bacterium]